MWLFPTHLAIHRSSHTTNFQHETPLDSTTHNLHGCTKTGKTIHGTHCPTYYHRQTHTLENKKPNPLWWKTDHSPKGNCSNQTISKKQIDVRKQTWNAGQRRNTPVNYWRLVKLATLCSCLLPLMVVMSCILILCEPTWSCVSVHTAVAFRFCNVYFCEKKQHEFSFILQDWDSQSCSTFFLFCCCEHLLSYVRVNLCYISLGIVAISGVLTSWFSLAYVVVICLCLVHCFFENVSFFSLSYSWPLFWTSR